MKVKSLFIFAVLTALLSSCASEIPWGRKYDKLSVSDCVFSRSTDTDSIYIIDMKHFHLEGVYPFTVSIFDNGGKCDIAIKNVYMQCSYKCVPHIVTEAGSFYMKIDVVPPEDSEILTACVCLYDVSFETDAIPSGMYHLKVDSQDYYGDNDITLIEDICVDVYDGEPSISRVYLKYGMLVELSEEDIELLDLYFSKTNMPEFHCSVAKSLGLI